jgi:hypothetical protein
VYAPIHTVYNWTQRTLMRFIGGLMLAWFPTSIYGVTPVRVAELAEIIRSRPAEDADKKAAIALADINLVERLTDDTLARMIREAPGRGRRQPCGT